MTEEQFEDIKSRAWSWYLGNMLEWAIKTLREVQDAPQWVKDCLASDTIVCPSMDDEVFALAHSDEIEKILRESQKRNFYVNYSKEVTEFFEAKRDNNEYAMIDALCDMFIIAMNAGLKLGIVYGNYFSSNEANRNITEPLTYFRDDLYCLCDELRQKGYDPYRCLLETIKELNSRTGSWNEEEGKWVKYKGAYTKEEARAVAKEILKKDYVEYPHSVLRDGQRYWQFVSENHFEIKEWYKADYESCKLKSVE